MKEARMTSKIDDADKFYPDNETIDYYYNIKHKYT